MSFTQICTHRLTHANILLVVVRCGPLSERQKDSRTKGGTETFLQVKWKEEKKGGRVLAEGLIVKRDGGKEKSSWPLLSLPLDFILF